MRLRPLHAARRPLELNVNLLFPSARRSQAGGGRAGGLSRCRPAGGRPHASSLLSSLRSPRRHSGNCVRARDVRSFREGTRVPQFQKTHRTLQALRTESLQTKSSRSFVEFVSTSRLCSAPLDSLFGSTFFVLHLCSLPQLQSLIICQLFLLKLLV